MTKYREFCMFSCIFNGTSDKNNAKFLLNKYCSKSNIVSKSLYDLKFLFTQLFIFIKNQYEYSLENSILVLLKHFLEIMIRDDVADKDKYFCMICNENTNEINIREIICFNTS